MKRYLIFLFLTPIFFFSKNTFSQEFSPELTQLAEWLTGDFSSPGHTSTLHLVPMWPDVIHGAWVYAEEVLNDDSKKTISQRIFFVSEINESEFSLDEYSLPNKEKFEGTWENPNAFDGMKVFDLKTKKGCTLFTFYDGFQYAGQTNTGTCKNSEQGAAYSTSVIMILPQEISLLERGYNDKEELVWGTDEGAVVYKRIKD